MSAENRKKARERGLPSGKGTSTLSRLLAKISPDEESDDP